MITAICQECGKQFDYDLKPGYPRKYCPECSAAKKQAYEDNKPVEVVKPGNIVSNTTSNKVSNTTKPNTEIKAPTGEYQSLVYNKTLSANSYEVGRAGSRFKIYFETVEELQAKIKELKATGLMEEEVDFKQAQQAFS